MAWRNADDLDSTETIDNRWTLDKLRRAGYEEEWSRPCRTCGDLISVYKKAGHGTSTQLLVLNDPVLDPHVCEGRR